MRDKTKYNFLRYNYLLFRCTLCSVFFLLLLTGITETAFACRYNVRETGFVYLAQKPYQLIVYYSDISNEKEIEVIRNLAIKHFSNSNIEPLLVNISSEVETREFISLIPGNHNLLPCAVLKSTDGQTMVMPLKDDKLSLDKSVNKVFRNISFSKERDEVMQKCINNYGVVLILEGTDAEANLDANKEAKMATTHVESKMSLMPKKINNAPVIVSINNNNTDKILNWSLGIDKEVFEKPKVFVIYGRGRWIGPVLEGELISKKNLSELLIIIGADCECGIDREWIRGTMIPVKWDKKDRQSVAENLEFDPENPLIKKEVRNILRMGEIFGKIPQGDTVSNFSEFIIADGNNQLNQVEQQTDKNQSKYFLLLISAIAVLIFTSGLFLFLKKKRS